MSDKLVHCVVCDNGDYEYLSPKYFSTKEQAQKYRESLAKEDDRDKSNWAIHEVRIDEIF